MKDPLLLISCLVISISINLIACSSQRQLTKNIEGEFLASDNSGIRIILKNKEFSVVTEKKYVHVAPPLCDTIAIGTYTEKNNFLVLNSASWLNPIFVNMEVTEKKNDIRDSVFFQ